MSSTARGDALTASATTARTMPALVSMSCSRVMPGFRAMPAVMMTMSESAAAA